MDNKICKFYVKIDNDFLLFHAVNGKHAKSIAKNKHPNSIIGDVVSYEKYDMYKWNKWKLDWKSKES
jgi:hypothetical protein